MESLPRFEFATAGRILFGRGTLEQLGPFIAEMGSPALVVTGREPARAARLLQRLEEQGIRCVVLPTAGEPTLESVRATWEFARQEGCAVVLGFGGGSALDTAKAVAGLLTNDGPPERYLEVVGPAFPLTRPAAPLVAIPTTAGTGSEVTRNAVISVPDRAVKVSMRSPYLLPRLALVDPELTLSCPPEVTAACGLDALTQLIEPFVSTRANPLTDALCREGLPFVSRSLYRAWVNGQDVEAREDMALASLLSGLALANAGLGAVHGLAAALGGMFRAPHGALCARLLPAVMRTNILLLESETEAHPTLERYREIARLLTGEAEAAPEDGVAWVEALVETVRIPQLQEYGVGPGDLDALVERAQAASSMRANPVVLTPAQLRAILEASL
ncbi:MAG: iron-containing alcohol dehydrogenase [Chloroflexia bacterium]